ncbi:MAG: hypothetical protein ISN29_01285 [Gammaproteobacteria bacterium AqS3]|nr:hypothetical protein [Gammaproteobacteria bacterium AqS3]
MIRSGYLVTTSFKIKYELMDDWGYGPVVLDMDDAMMLFFGLFAWFVYRNVRGLLLWAKHRPVPACDFND